jgi:NAD(P)-dependent dehydrogenase (short-subunit alcohol dehydrogenase family)
LAARGASVIVNYYNNKEAADKVVQEIKKAKNKEAAEVRATTGGYAIAIQADVRKQTQVECMVGEG